MLLFCWGNTNKRTENVFTVKCWPWGAGPCCLLWRAVLPQRSHCQRPAFPWPSQPQPTWPLWPLTSGPSVRRGHLHESVTGWASTPPFPTNKNGKSEIFTDKSFICQGPGPEQYRKNGRGQTYSRELVRDTGNEPPCPSSCLPGRAAAGWWWSPSPSVICSSYPPHLAWLSASSLMCLQDAAAQHPFPWSDNQSSERNE